MVAPTSSSSRPAATGDIWGSFGTLGQDEAGSVGQRIIRLTENGEVRPNWVADHGSAHCPPDNSSVTGLQHDTQIGKLGTISLLTDTTDAVGRCHDPEGGGIEIIDVSSVTKAEAAPREVHLVRFAGFSHTQHHRPPLRLDRLQQLLGLRRPSTGSTS